jgi:hypothetical protein
MALEYTWNFNSIKVKPQLNDLSDVVVTYEWRRGVKDGDHFVDCYGSVSLTDPEPDSFKDYSELTKEDVINWTVSILTQEKIDEYDASLATQMENLKNPPLVTKPTPWNN